MKKKIMALICVVTMMAALLVGCGGKAEQETTVPVQTAETAAAVAGTTVPVEEMSASIEETMVPTEPQTLFEEQGLIFWEGWDYLEDVVPVGAEGNKTNIKVTAGEQRTLNNEMLIYDRADPEFKESYNYITELVDADMSVRIYEYTSDALEPAGIAEMVDPFYIAYNVEKSTALSKEEWKEKHSDYVLKHFQVEMDVSSESFFKNAISKLGETYYYWSVVENPYIVDVKQNVSYHSPDQKYEVLQFMVGDEENRQTAYAFSNYHFYIEEVPSGLGDGHWEMAIFLFVPADCEDLAFAWADPIEAKSAQEWIEWLNTPETTAWELRDLTEEIAANPKCVFYFFK